MPYVMIVHYQRPHGHRLRLWIPVLPVLLIFSPLLLLGIAVGVGADLYLNGRPWVALQGIGRVVGALRGTRVAIDDADRHFMLSLR